MATRTAEYEEFNSIRANGVHRGIVVSGTSRRGNNKDNHAAAHKYQTWRQGVRGK